MITYESICEKLGFELSECQVVRHDTEFDAEGNPFDVLKIEEIDFLLDNGYI